MNAPATAQQLASTGLELIPLKAIIPSMTAVQAERRKRYDKAALDELAASIKVDGLVQPVVVRPWPTQDQRAGVKYELVAGERRWIATGRAGQDQILARVLRLTDEQVLKAQMVENLHREGLHPLAEARGYRELIAGGVKAEAIGDMIGKSRSYVYARVKLLEICPAAQEALNSGELTADQALLFARIPGEKLQEVALKTVRNWAYQGHGERLSFRRTAEILKDKAKGILIPLAQVPFRLDDPNYWTFGPKRGKDGAQDAIALPTCHACPKRSGNDPELLAAIEDPNVCTDRDCHDSKAKQEFERRRKQAQASGREVLTGEAAAAIAPTKYGTRGYVDLDEACEDDRLPEPEPTKGKGESEEAYDQRYADWEERDMNYQSRTFRQILGDTIAGLDIQLVQDPRNKSRLRELAPDKAVAKLLKDKGITARFSRDTSKPTPPPKPADPAKLAARQEKEEQERAAKQIEEHIEREFETRLLKAVHEKFKGPLQRDDLELIAEHIVEDYEAGEVLDVLYGENKKRPSLATMNDRDLVRTIMVVLVGRSYVDRGDDRAVRALAKRAKVDPKAIEKQVRAEFAPKGEGGKKAAAKKKGGKK